MRSFSIVRRNSFSKVSETIWPLRVSAAYGARLGATTLQLGPDALLALGLGGATGMTSLDAGSRLVLALGGAAALHLPLGGWDLVAEVAGYRHAAGHRFRADGAGGGRAVLEAPVWQGLAGLGLYRAFSP